MLRFRTLGELDLSADDGVELRSILTQPKRLALLAYLAIAARHGYLRRDTLLALFWPDLDEDHARGALNRAVYYLRRALGDGVIVSRGSEELGISQQNLWCDAVAFEEAAERGRFEDALDLYRGDLLEGFFVSGVPEFERWLEAERARLRERAAGAARTLAENAEAACDSSLAVRWVRRAIDLSPYDEGLIRQLIGLLDQAGDRAAAVHAYEEFSARLKDALDVEPSAETEALVEAIRSGNGPQQSSELTHVPPQAPKSAEFRASGPRSGVSDAVAAQAQRKRKLLARRRRIMVASVGGIAAIAAFAGVASLFNGRDPGIADVGSPNWVFVAEFENPGSDPEVAAAAHDLVTAALDQSATLAPVPLDQVRRALQLAGQPDTARLNTGLALELAYRYSIGAVVAGRVTRLGDSYTVFAQVLQPEDGSSVIAVTETASGVDDMIPALDRMTRRLLSGLGERQHAIQTHPALEEVTTPSFEAYRLYRRASQLEGNASSGYLRKALELDPEFAMAWRMLGANYNALNQPDSSRGAIERALQLGERLSRTEQLHIEAFAAYMFRWDLQGTVGIYDQLLRINPRDWRAHYNRGVNLDRLGRHDEALRHFRAVERLSPFGMGRRASGLAWALFRVGRGDEAEEYFEELREFRPNAERSLKMQLAAARDDFATAESLAVTFRDDPAVNFENWPTVMLAAAKASRGAIWEATNTLGMESVEGGWGWADHRMALALATECGAMGRVLPLPAWSDTNSFHLLSQAISAVLVGDVALARQLRDRERQRPEYDRAKFQGLRPVLDGFLWADAGDWSALVTSLGRPARRVVPYDSGGQLTLRWLVARAYEHLGQLDSAAVYYSLVLDPLRLNSAALYNRGFMYPFAHRKLASLYAQLGQRRTAEHHWQAFRDVFRTPDPELQWMIEESPLEGKYAERFAESCASYLARPAASP